MAAPAARKLRVLMLHGHAQTGEEMRSKCGSLRSEVKKWVDFVYYDSPGRSPDGKQTYYDYKKVTDTESEYTNVEAALKHLAQTFEEEGPFDGVWAFSMGGVMAHWLADGMTHGTLPPAVKFNFAVLFSTPYGKDPRYPVKGGIAIPSWHCYGTADEIIPAASSHRVAETFEKPALMVHEGGHLMPSFPPVRKNLKEFVKMQHAAANQ
eukprot:TRINITY_DN6934_c0_g1_i1.p2 TRINITY_DN6934_c0_g1~~TRINITY_DN6934_c0_g1_i1.p2  ORF type:complete len:208 (+),score=91.80 TRINITY_DN6934_c0_g1_i1:82-705(+)